MLYRRVSAVYILSVCTLLATAKDKKKALLPGDVLQAHTALVMVDPNAGVDIEDPNANRAARDNVEKALLKWGRLTPVPSGSKADLVIVIRISNGKASQTTIGGTRVNNTPPAIAHSNDSSIMVAGNAHRGGMTDPSDAQSSGSSPDDGAGSRHPGPQLEVGSTQDMLVLYRWTADPLNAPPVWRYSAKGALESPDVPAVDVMRKLFADSEKQLASKP